MDILEVLDQVRALLQGKGRVSYRILKRQFDLDEETLEDLKYELTEVEGVARDYDGKMLVWSAEEGAPTSSPGASPTPARYTPPHLAERILAEGEALESRGSADGERKTITALFADLKGSTALIGGLDPEEARRVLDPALQLMMDAVHRYDGFVAQALGDGIFALFGAPLAHEDHPQRALYAALRMQKEMRGFGDELRREGHPPLQLRVGVNTGEVVVRSIRKDDLNADYTPVGHSTHVAARMEQLANPGSILVAEPTYKLAEGFFEFVAVGETQVRGVDEPVPIYEVTGAGSLRTPLQVAARRGFSRFVGRHREMDQLQQALEQAKAGQGQVVGVLGEPGLGKSRLFHEFKQILRTGCLVLEALSVSHGKASPYLPVTELLKTYFQIEPADNERMRRAKVIGHVAALDKSLEGTLPYLLALLGAEEPNSPLQQMHPKVRRQRTYDSLKKLLLRESLNQPLVLVFEDLHWIDTETQAALDTLAESVASARVLLLVNYRPEHKHQWGTKTYYTQIRLAPLGVAEANELLNSLLGKGESLRPLRRQIVERTQGTPFFIEEVVQALVEQGVLVGDRGNYRVERMWNELQLPTTVQGVLAARIDRLTSEEKHLLQQLAVIGRRFPVNLVQEVVSLEETEFFRILAALQAKEFLYEQPAFPHVEYHFKHALTKDVAYGTVLHQQRKVLHESTGHAMEALYQESLDHHYNELAHHFSESGNAEKAVAYLHLAGQQAVQRSGMASFEVEQTYTRALELCQQLDAPQHLPPVLSGLCTLYLGRGDPEQARKMAQQCFTVAQHAADSTLLLSAHSTLGLTLYFMGDLVPSQEHLEKGFRLYDPQRHSNQAHLVPYGMDPGALCLGIGAQVILHLGFPDQAIAHMHAATQVAQASADPYTMAGTWYNAACVHLYRRESRAAQEHADATIALSADFPTYKNWAKAVRGWVLAIHGQEEAGVAEIEQAIAAMEEAGLSIGRGWALLLLAEAYALAGRVPEGLVVLKNAVQEYRTLFAASLPEAYRLIGELMLMQQSLDVQEAEINLHQALRLARKQQARSWELRAATSLARLWQSQGKTAAARDLLAAVYDWFTEGFDTRDLKDAKVLLDELE